MKSIMATTSRGNPFLAFESDGVAIERVKLQSMCLGGLGENWDRFVFCVAQFPVASGVSEDIAAAADGLMKERVGVSIKDCALTV